LVCLSQSCLKASVSWPLFTQGFITSAEFLAIPELSINPLAKRLAYMFESINFKELVVRCAHPAWAALLCSLLRAVLGAVGCTDLLVALWLCRQQLRACPRTGLQGILATMRPDASREDKLRTMFHVYDVDGERPFPFCTSPLPLLVPAASLYPLWLQLLQVRAACLDAYHALYGHQHTTSHGGRLALTMRITSCALHSLL